MFNPARNSESSPAESIIEEPKREHVNIPLRLTSMWVNSPITAGGATLAWGDV